jgi:hypothetical protein
MEPIKPWHALQYPLQHLFPHPHNILTVPIKCLSLPCLCICTYTVWNSILPLFLSPLPIALICPSNITFQDFPLNLNLSSQFITSFSQERCVCLTLCFHFVQMKIGALVSWISMISVNICISQTYCDLI